MKTIVYHKNGIGNLIMMSPAIQAMYELAGEKIDICIPEWQDSRRQPCIDLMNAWNIVNDVVTIPEKEYDTWFYTEHSEYGKVFDTFRKKQKRIMTQPNWISLGIHESEYYMKHARALGFKGDTPKQFCPITKFDIGFKRNKKLRIGICNGYFKVKMWDKKAWPYFKELVHYLRNWFDCEIVKIGIGKELEDIDADFDFVGKITLPKTAYAISRLDLFITTDTGNMHIADALNTKTIALFGSTLLTKNKPLNENSHILTANLRCVPCQCSPRFNTCKDYECMKKLYIGDVMKLARSILHGL